MKLENSKVSVTSEGAEEKIGQSEDFAAAMKLFQNECISGTNNGISAELRRKFTELFDKIDEVGNGVTEEAKQVLQEEIDELLKRVKDMCSFYK
ncbi:hypothetical protein GF354_02935 [Candidatus Peregrinibacteria bacterium]|nr:hypothetical protein [Candidatus Peregrinibacteria bacterium]